MSLETLLFEVKDGVARVTLNRPDDGNALDQRMAHELMTVSIQCDEDPSVRAVLISAGGKMFCVGGDLKRFSQTEAELPAFLKEMATYLHAGISRFARMRAPVIVAINGTAAGAGFSLACAGDLAIAAESSRFTMAYTRVGLTPDGSSTYYLPRLIGARRTLELMLTNRVLSAAEALDWGIVNRVVPDDRLDAEALRLAQTLAAGPTGAFASVKRMVLGSTQESLESQMELETRAICDAARTDDARAGIEAFFQKRDATFAGS
jgi:2-(1,2-epoxy-1,2-dihydrophenyl)acetyl-CoA isomerase